MARIASDSVARRQRVMPDRLGLDGPGVCAWDGVARSNERR